MIRIGRNRPHSGRYGALFFFTKADELQQGEFVTQDLGPPAISQRALFDNLDHERAAKVMAAMDEANRRWGRATVGPAATMSSAVKTQTFTTNFEMRSPRFTTRWDELPVTR